MTIGCTNKFLINDTVWILNDCLTIAKEKCINCPEVDIHYFRADGYYKKIGTDIYWYKRPSGLIEDSASIGKPFSRFEGKWEQVDDETIVATAKCIGWPYKIIGGSFEDDPIFNPQGRMFVDTFYIVNNRTEKDSYIKFKDSTYVKFDKFKKAYLNLIIEEVEGFDKIKKKK